MRRQTQSAFANPVLIGAVTVLVLLVAVFLSYNANQGLPFVPTRELKVDIANGSDLVVGNDVREGGYLIGNVSEMKPKELPNGQVGAEVTLKLSKNYGNVPQDSTVTIRTRSALINKYIDLHKGVSKQMFPDGGTMLIGQTNVPVQFDDILKTFDEKTRTAMQQDLVGFGDALAARGSALNDTIASLPALFQHLQPVAQYLSDPSTQLTRFLASLNQFMGAVAPVAQTNAQLFTDMATTFEAISRDPNALESTIAESPSTLQVSTDSLRVQQPFLVDLTGFANDLTQPTPANGFTPAAPELVSAIPQINPALEIGARTLPRTPSLNANLQQLLSAVQNLAQSPGTNIALNALTDTVQTLNPMVRFIGPYQTVCNDWNYWWTYLSEHISQETTVGFAQRVLLNFANMQKQSVGQQGASQPANGQDVPPGQYPEFLHGQTYGAAVDNNGFADCETGQRGYVKKLNFFDPRQRNLATDAHTPGNQGPTYAGRSQVPAGETFSRNPTSGPQLPVVPNNQ